MDKLNKLNKKIIFIAVGVLIVCALGGFLTSKLISNRANKIASATALAIVPTGVPTMQISASPTPTASVSPKPTAQPTTTTQSAPVSTPAPVVVKAVAASAPGYSAAFQWGVTMRPNVLGKYSSNTWGDQITKAKGLGVGWARINWDYDNSDPVGRNTAVIDQLKSSGIQPLLVIEHNPNNGNSNLYQQGLNDAATITGALKGKVDYYQLANEGGAQSLISGRSGVSPSDFDDGRYNEVRDYIKGLSDGIAKGDPGAKRIVTISWTHTGFLDRLTSDGVNFDMIGIDWYSWMGSFSAKKINNTETVYAKLQSFNKPLSFMEVSTMPTPAGSDSKIKTNVDEDLQSNFLSSTANWAWSNRNWIKGFYHFELVDNTFTSGYTDYYGLVKVNNVGGVATLGDVRKAYNTYRDIISGK